MNPLQQPIAVGRTAEIIPFEDGKVLKLFFPTIPQPWIDKEVDTGRFIQDRQLPVPKVFQRLKLNDREGIVYERIEGPSLLSVLARKPWTVQRCARLLARLHARVHDVTAPPDLETQKEWARGGIPETNKLSKDLQERVLLLLDSMPEGNQLCHGDFHPGNIIVTHRGPVIIDWMTASKGVGCGMWPGLRSSSKRQKPRNEHQCAGSWNGSANYFRRLISKLIFNCDLTKEIHFSPGE